MNIFEAIEKRVSVRKFKPEAFSEAAIKKALEMAVLAPNSSNLQCWDFYWVKNKDKKQKLVEACFSQSAARTASALIVVTADPKKWKRSQNKIISYVESVKAPKLVQDYYKKLVPLVYSWGFLNIYAPIKWFITTIIGFSRPMARGPYSRGDVEEVVIKSAALACENFVLSITAQGGASCMMEGFDEQRVKKLINASCTQRVVMVIAVGYEGERGTWGPRFRIPNEEVIHILD